MSDVVTFLARKMRRDCEDHEPNPGLRSTVEIAEAMDLTTSQARRALWKACDAGTVEVFDATPLLWRVAERKGGE